ncbi:response regulator [Haloterrigena sp. SYSU A558-1]|uniref:Response regulator n=1 Tax=Haloterrigena gelatinilytica TaxID=2741724 RepID=A0A8J8GGV6_9EURY|nr:response regulator [Haloterrigena gelatinilytica]NUC74715.1 response regulator [Haloterrigena gelatinilytica]
MDGPNSFGEILLVEDNPGDVRLTKELLKETGYDPTVHVVSDGPDALEFLSRRGDYADAPRPDAILLDLHLPRMDGTDVLERMDDDVRDVPVIVLSGAQRDQEFESDEIEAVVDARVQKPLDPDEFDAIVQSLSEQPAE